MPWHDSRGLGGKLESYFQRRALNRALFVTSPSISALDHLVKTEVISKEAAVFDPNLLDLRVDGSFSQQYRVHDPLRLLFCGRLVPQKGLDSLIETLSRVRRPIHLVIAGVGEAESDLRARAARMADGPHTVVFKGHIDNVEPLIDWCHLAIMPSRSELEPVFVWESWARGRAVIGRNITAFRDLSKYGPMHLFSNEEDIIAILEAADSGRPPFQGDYARAIKSLPSECSRSAVVDFLMNGASSI
ncbi:glycosyltransferase family 4 protein [Gordonia sp. DT218]|uniref:glycosyltransferase family 4 protein n=1 Tax=Gordonia sp. DT218 TaxID=3416659 RepID=UPI003CF92810